MLYSAYKNISFFILYFFSHINNKLNGKAAFDYERNDCGFNPISGMVISHFCVACRQSEALSDATQHAKSEKLGGKRGNNCLTLFSTIYRAPPIYIRY